jgi:hypothetical protein
LSRRCRSKTAVLQALLLCAAMPAGLAWSASPPPPPEVPQPPSNRSASDVDELPAIFLYRVDARCRVTATRMLQGPETMNWRHVQEHQQIEQQRIVWRMVDGVRSQLHERRVKLRGELVETGELVCHIRPAGQVLEAWIERRDDSPARRRALQREPVTVTDGRIADLGTYSLTLEPAL